MQLTIYEDEDGSVKHTYGYGEGRHSVQECHYCGRPPQVKTQDNGQGEKIYLIGCDCCENAFAITSIGLGHSAYIWRMANVGIFGSAKDRIENARKVWKQENNYWR